MDDSIKNKAIDVVTGIALRFVEEHYGRDCKYQEDPAERGKYYAYMTAIQIVKGLKSDEIQVDHR